MGGGFGVGLEQLTVWDPSRGRGIISIESGIAGLDRTGGRGGC